MERWTDKWEQVHREQSALHIAQLAIEKACREREWWEEFNDKMRQKPETD